MRCMSNLSLSVFWRRLPLFSRLGRRRLSSEAPVVILVDGQRTIELVRAELALSLAAHSTRRVQLMVVGRQGIAVALRAAAMLRPVQGDRMPLFALAAASADELVEAGLEHEGDDAVHKTDASCTSTPDGRGFRLDFPPRSTTAGTLDAALWPNGSSRVVQNVELEQAAQQVLKVGGSTRLLPLAKSVATTVSRLPEGGFVAVETALKGKSKNVWNRTHLMAQAVAIAHKWQECPAAGLVGRPFRCLATTLHVAVGRELGNGRDSAEKSADTAVELDILRLSLVPLRDNAT